MAKDDDFPDSPVADEPEEVDQPEENTGPEE